MLNEYQLNESKLPHFSLHKKSQLFTVISRNNNNVKSLVESKISEILRQELIQLKETAKKRIKMILHIRLLRTKL